MKVLSIIFLLQLSFGCSNDDFSSFTSNSSPSSADGSDAEAGWSSNIAGDALTEGFSYDGDPIVLKDPPDDSYALYTDIGSEWQTKVVTPRTGTHELNGTSRTEERTIARIVATRQGVQSVSQISRIRYMPFIAHQTGQTSSTTTETFTQNDRGLLDVLLVLDNSGSMSGEIAHVRSNLGSLLSHIGGSDWQIAMVRAEPSGSCTLEGRIMSTQSDYATAYSSLLSFSTSGGTEHMLKKARWALEGGGGCSSSWLRQNSVVAVIVVTDEEHQCPSTYHCSPSAWGSFVSSFGHDIRSYGFTSGGWDTSIFDWHASVTSSYSTGLSNISSDIQAHLLDIFPLAFVPDEVSMTVTVGGWANVSKCGGGKTTGCFRIVDVDSKKAIEFIGAAIPSKSSSIVVDYTYGGQAFDSVWTLPHTPLPSRLSVSVTKSDGSTSTLTKDNHFEIGGNNDRDIIVHNVETTVPQGASIRVSYLENKKPKKKFVLDENTGSLPAGAMLLSDTVKITITDDGEHVRTLSGGGYEFDGTTLTFTNSDYIPTAGIVGTTPAQAFTVSYDYEYGIQTVYSFSEHPDHRPASDVKCKNQNGNRVDCVSDASADTITFTDESQLAIGDTITIKERLRKQGNNISFTDSGWLPEEGVQVELEGMASCTVAGDSPYIDGDTLLLQDMNAEDCAIAQYLEEGAKQVVGFEYKVYEDEAEDFLQMDEDFFAEHRGEYKFEYWEVFVNDVRTNKFEVENYKLEFHDDVEIENNSTIKIKVHLYHAL